MSEPYNVLGGELDESDDRPGFAWRGTTVGPRLGAEGLGMSVYELGHGERICPYHFEHGNEEWLIVLAGEPTVRTPEGERRLVAGDVVCFPDGPAGAHAVRGPGRVAMLSTKNTPAASEYPDSDKIAFWAREADYLLRRRPLLDYWDGETDSK